MNRQSIKPSQHQQWVDVAKGIAIIAILLHHIPFHDSANKAILYPYVAQFDVPLFFIVAGFFISTKLKASQFIIQKAKRLLLPYLVTCIAIGLFVICCKMATGVTNPPTIFTGVKEFIASCVWGAGTKFKTLPEGVNSIGAIWFLEALFVALIEVRLVLERLMDKPFVGFAVIALLALVATMTRPIYYIPCNIQQGLVGGLYVYLGHLYRRYFGLERRSGLEVTLIFAFAFLLSGKVITPLSTVSASFGKDGLLALAASLCACALIVNVSISLEESKAASLLSFFGSNSLVVLCVHLTMLDCGYRRLVESLFRIIPVEVPSQLIAATDLVSQMVICALAVIIIKRTRFLKIVFY